MESAETQNMQPNVQDIVKHFSKSVINYIVGTSVAILTVGIAFYYNTQNSLSNHQTDLLDLKNSKIEEQYRLNNVEMKVAIDNTQINSIDKRMSGVETKLDKVYDLLVKMNKNN